MAYDWGPFLTYWGTYCKDVFQNAFMGESRISFSEGLLRTLYYETDVGSIPRGISMDSRGTVPKFSSTENWNTRIQGCYWCMDDNNTLNGICCGKDCLYFLHEWCIERGVHFTGDRFCRFPGCDKTSRNGIYCNQEHRARFDSVFPKWTDHKSILKTVIRAGPSWYHENSINTNNTPPQSTHNYNLRSTSTNNSTQSKTEVKFLGYFPPEFREMLIHNTDIGSVPRVHPTQEDFTSKFSQCPNWSAVIKGCYFCGRPEMKDPLNDHFCRLQCYLLFYEWCRTKVESKIKIRFCQYPECDRKASEGFKCCNREHTREICELYEKNNLIDIERKISVAPKWYIKANAPNELYPDLTQNQSQQMAQHYTNSYVPQQSPIQYNNTINFLFSQQVTLFMYLNTDIGPIPRGIEVYLPKLQREPLSPNWHAQINLCYWCCMKPPVIHYIACSHKCLFFFIEWLHRKYEAISNVKLCKSLGCPAYRYFGFQCCNREHSTSYESSFKEFFPFLRSTDFALGPIWYRDYSCNRIEFYNREDPFYELSNFYPCDNLFFNGVQWKTTEHYFQAMKFNGTPYLYYVSTLPFPRDAFSFSRKPQAMKWIHPCWHKVKLQVMLNVLRAKFSDPFFAQILLRTGDAALIEHTKNDKFWGDGGDGSGENKLGILLMQVRSELFSSGAHPIYHQEPMPTQHIPLQSHNNQQHISRTEPPRELINQIYPSAPLFQENINSTNEKRSLPVETNVPKKHTEERELSGFIANLNPIKSTSNIDMNTNNTLVPNIQIKSGEAKFQLPSDYECPFNMSTDNLETEPLGEESPQTSTLPIDLARIEAENNQTQLVNCPNQTPFPNPQGTITNNTNPFLQDNNTDQQMDTSKDSGDLLDLSGVQPMETASNGGTNPFARVKNSDDKSQNYNENSHTQASSDHPMIESEQGISELEGLPTKLLKTNSSSDIKSTLSDQNLIRDVPPTDNASTFVRIEIFADEIPHSPKENTVAPVSDDQSMEVSEPNDPLVTNSGSADQVQASPSKSLVSTSSSEDISNSAFSTPNKVQNDSFNNANLISSGSDESSKNTSYDSFVWIPKTPEKSEKP